MNNIKILIKKHPAIFGLLAIAFVLDITGAMSSSMPGVIFGLPSLLVIVYCLGIAMLIRFVIARRRIHLAITLPIMIVLYFGWFIIIAVLTDGEPYKPSLLFMLCLLAVFKTMRIQIEQEPENNESSEQAKEI